MEALLIPAVLIAIGIGFRALRPQLPPDPPPVPGEIPSQ